MNNLYLIGVDIGTQGTKAALYSKSGELIANAFEPSRLINLSSGIVEQDPNEIYSSVLNTIREVMNTSGVDVKNVAAIGLDGQMAGILGIDNDFNAVTHYDSWLDTRCGKYIEHIKNIAEEGVIQITGCPVTYTHGPKILWWKNERPETYQKIAKFVVPTTYVVGRLTGLKATEAYIDYTQIHFSGFADVEGLRWSEELLDIFNVEIDKMPKIVEPWEIMGRLTKEAATLCGLVSGIPVVAGCGDQAASSLGAGVTSKGMIFDVAGTASVLSCCVDKYSPDIQNKTIVFPRSIIKGLWIPLAYISGGGLCLKWFRDNVNCKNSSFTELDSEAENVAPGSEGLVFIPHFSGRTCPNDENVKGTWIGLNWNHERKHLYRSIMESIAYEYGYYLKILKSLLSDCPFKNVVAIGGGSKSKLFNLIKADVLDIPYYNLKNEETATLGSAVTAGYGAGIYEDIATTIQNIVKKKDEILIPNTENYKLYQNYCKLYEDLFRTLKDTFRVYNEHLNKSGNKNG